MKKFPVILKGILLITIPIFAVVVLVFFFQESGAWHPECPFRTLTGLYCPGCGTLRALHALGNGHIGEAFGHNVLTVMFLPYMLFMWVIALIQLFRKRQIVMPKNRIVSWAIVWIVIIFFILRNIPYAPFSYLAP